MGAGAPLLPQIDLGDNLDIGSSALPHGYEAYHTLPTDGYSNIDVREAHLQASSHSQTLSQSAQNSSLYSLASKEKPTCDEPKTEETPSRWARLCSNTWIFEVVTMAFSMACMAAIVVILWVYDGKELHPLPWGLTLNAIVSALATGAEACLVGVLGSAISQLKWDWFHKSRRLYEMQIFDDASRGALGSFKMLVKRTGNIVAIIGAVLIILALIFDPFIQQVIRYPLRTTISIDGNASTRRASGFRPVIGGVDMTGAMYAGMWANAAQFAPDPVCTSGDCRWTEFESLGWCSKCEDVTSQAILSPSCKTVSSAQNSTACNLSLGSGANTTIASWTIYPPDDGPPVPTISYNPQVVWNLYSIGSYVEANYANASVPKGLLKSTNMLDIPSPALVLGYAQIDNSGTFDEYKLDLKLNVSRAEQCALTPCVRKYSMRTSSGSLESNVTAINYGAILDRTLPAPLLKNISEGWHTTCWQPDSGDVDYTYIGMRDGLASSECFHVGCYYWTNNTLSAFCPVAEYVAQIAPFFESSSRQEYTYDEDASLWSSGNPILSSNTILRVAAHNLTFVTENVAASLTALGLSGGDEAITGAVEVSRSHIMVRWDWLIYPIILELMGLLVFGITVIQTRKHKTLLWRSSLLPLLFHEPQIRDSDRCQAPWDVAGMEIQAGKVYTTLPSRDRDRTSAFNVESPAANRG